MSGMYADQDQHHSVGPAEPHFAGQHYPARDAGEFHLPQQSDVAYHAQYNSTEGDKVFRLL